MGRKLLDEVKKSYIIKSQKRIGDVLSDERLEKRPVDTGPVHLLE